MPNIALAQTIKGWMSDGELLFLAEQASRHKIILEVGSYCGRSTRAMADNTTGTIYAIDPWDGDYQVYGNPRDLAYMSYHQNGNLEILKEFQRNLDEHFWTERVIPCRMKFEDFKPIVVPDMIFIDAIHDYGPVKHDIFKAMKLMENGGLLCGHDYSGNWPGVIKAVDEVFGQGIQVHESIWWVEL